MAFAPAPTAPIANYTSDGTNMTLPIASFSELTAAEAHTTTGDSRKLLFALCSRFYDWFNGLATADKPTKATITKSISTNAATGVTTQVFTFTFTTAILTQDVVAE